jgi:hypothetical protein
MAAVEVAGIADLAASWPVPAQVRRFGLGRVVEDVDVVGDGRQFLLGEGLLEAAVGVARLVRRVREMTKRAIAAAKARDHAKRRMHAP